MSSIELLTLTTLFYENRRELSVLMVMGILFGYAFYFFQSQKFEEGSEVEERGVLQMENIVVNNFQETLKGWQLQGEKAIIIEESRRMRIEKVQIWIYVPYSIDVGQPIVELSITADEGLVEWQDSRVTLLGNVVLNRQDGSTILTKTAVYDTDLKFLTLPKPVRIIKKGHTLEGKSLTFKVGEEKLKLIEPVLVRYQ